MKKENTMITDWLDQYGDPEICKKVEMELDRITKEINNNKMTNKEALLYLWESVDKTSIYQLSYIRNLAYELGETELYHMFKNFDK
jgi:hypothetical protein